MKSIDAVIKDSILEMAGEAKKVDSDAVLSVSLIVAKCGGNAQFVRHVLRHLESKKLIRVEGSYQGDEYFTVHML